MSIPKLKKIKSEKKYHDLTLSDEYAWVDQPNILEVLKDANKLDPEVKDYIAENNKITEDYFKDVKDLQKNVWDYSPNLETHTVETHIYRLRKKIKDIFKDDKFIKSSKKGYTI